MHKSLRNPSFLRAGAVAGLLLALATATPTKAASVYGYGVGRFTCAYWLSTPTDTREGNSWIFGFWTALNVANASGRTPSERLDETTILREVRRICETRLSTPLAEAAQNAYADLERRRS